jgi:plastocyanin
MRKLAIALMLGATLAVAACGGGGSNSGGGGGSSGSGTSGGAATGAATISMATSSFSGTPTVTIKAGQTVTFDDPASGGGVHNLVTGTKGVFTAAPGAPDQFASATGVNFNPGDKKTITFATAGTYQITCTIHPSMQATVTVTQ